MKTLLINPSNKADLLVRGKEIVHTQLNPDCKHNRLDAYLTRPTI
jgi:hypothetical protein